MDGYGAGRQIARRAEALKPRDLEAANACTKGSDNRCDASASVAKLPLGFAQQPRPVLAVSGTELIVLGTGLQHVEDRVAIFDVHLLKVVLILASLVRAFKEFQYHMASVRPYGSGQGAQSKHIPFKAFTPEINFGCNALWDVGPKIGLPAPDAFLPIPQNNVICTDI